MVPLLVLAGMSKLFHAFSGRTAGEAAGSASMPPVATRTVNIRYSSDAAVLS
ncbi:MULTISPECIES: hypothetical protein [Nocardiaceae]|uniref:Uncharacterized protein n=1 Tax=Rhodococcoides yunnanense TaxID=278209 RepID=A0ABU4B6H7_9NOCA|nr:MULTISPECIES: hypothetical protein [Rhodococcus]MDI9894506.1 hypothetical protein [Rhodococcus sp. IEGM 1381]MDV6259792.1 hypothetical protein [Rhodococcus yunnanensis]